MIITRYSKDVVDRAIRMRKLSEKIQLSGWKKQFAFVMQPVTVPGHNDTSTQSYALFRTYYQRHVTVIKRVYYDSFDVEAGEKLCVPSMDSLCYYSLAGDNENAVYKKVQLRENANKTEIMLVKSMKQHALQTKAPVLFCEFEPARYGTSGSKDLSQVYRNMYQSLTGTKYEKDKRILTPEQFDKIAIAYIK